MKMADQLVPNPLVSDRQYCRFYYLDLPELEDVELTDELHYLRPLLWGLTPAHWLRERVARLEAEMQKRRGDSKYGASKRRTPKPAEGVVL